MGLADGTAFYERSSPSLLSQQPTDPKPFVPLDNWGQLFKHVEARMGLLRSWRLSWWEHWGLLAEYILPRRYHWLITANNMSRGLPINQSIVDPTGTQAMRVCAAGLMSGLTSPSRPWFKLAPGVANYTPDYAAQAWFNEVENRTYTVLARSNFYDSVTQMYEDLTTFGTAPVIIYEDDRDVIRCYNPCAGEYYLAADSTLRVDTFYRYFTMTVAQMIGMFGADNIDPSIQMLWKEKGSRLDTEWIVGHAIEPNFPLDNTSGAVLKGNFTWREVYWMWGKRTAAPLSLRGFKEAPFITPRWATTSNDPYGRSVAMDVLPDIIQLQVETRRKAEAIEKQVRPPLLASVELKNEPSSILPGHITYVSNLATNTGMRPIYQVQPELQFMTADLMQIQQRIQRGFFNDLFLMIANSPAVDRTTAYEIAQKNQEKLQVLGPVIERIQNEGLGHALRRTIQIMDRKGMLPPVPQSLQGIPITIEYISMLALAQRAQQTAAIERVLQVVGSIAAGNPEALDLVDDDQAIRIYADLMTVDPRIIRPPEAVQQIRTTRNQMQAKQQQAAQAGQAANDAIQGAQTLSQTDVGGGANALSLMLNGAGMGAGAGGPAPAQPGAGGP